MEEIMVILQSDWHIGGNIDYEKVLDEALKELNKYTMPGFTVVYTGLDYGVGNPGGNR